MRIDFDINQWKSKSEDEIQSEIDRLESIKMQRTNQEQSIKLLINSIYGAYGSVYFIMYSTDIAESITLQGQDIIKNADKYINLYFNKYWHNDHSLHEAMGITEPVQQIVSECTIYNDTDSAYVSFDQVLKSCSWNDDPKKFILSLYELRLKDFLDSCFDQYAKKFNTKNLQNFEMEMISESAIFIAKKKYILNPVWKDPGIHIESLTKIKPKGVEMIQGSTPVFVREKMITFMKYVFSEKKNLKYSEFVSMLKKAKSEFMVQPIDRISMTKTINDYEKYIANDLPASGDFSVRKHCPIHLRAAGYYNYLLNENKKYKSKYEMIKSSNKVKYYHCAEDDLVFAYHTNAHPYEFAPKMNFEIQFEKTIIAPMNRVLEVLGFPPVPGNLVTTKRLF